MISLIVGYVGNSGMVSTPPVAIKTSRRFTLAQYSSVRTFLASLKIWNRSSYGFVLDIIVSLGVCLCVEQFSTYSGDGRNDQHKFRVISGLIGGERWIRTTEALASDLQSGPFDRSGTSPIFSRE